MAPLLRTDLVGALTRRSPESTAMFVGFGSVGASAFVLFAVGPRALGPEGYTGLALAWTIVTIVGIGLALPGEQTITRGIAGGAGSRVITSVTRRLLVLPVGAASLFFLSLTPLAESVPNAPTWGAAVALSIAGWVWVARVRGQLAGHQEFGWYSATLIVEAAVRLLLCALALLFPGAALALLAMAIALPIIMSAVAGQWLLEHRRPVGSFSDFTASGSGAEQGSMTVVAVMMQICLSTAPMWLHSQSADAATAGAFVSASAYMRIPLLLSGGLYSIILAAVAQAYVGERLNAIRRWAGFGLLGGVAVSTFGVIVLIAISGPALRLLYGGDIGLNGAVVVWLGVATVGTVAASILTQVHFGCQRSAMAAVMWVVPAVATTSGLATTGGDVVKIAATVAIGQWIAVAALLLALPRSMRPNSAAASLVTRSASTPGGAQ